MIFYVLSFLPGSLLLRCKVDCKTWLSIILSPKFVEACLTNSKKKQASVLKASYDWRLCSIDTREESVRLKLPLHCQGMRFPRYLRFEFDSIGNDYKILRIADGYGSFEPEVELYSANADSWKKIEVPNVNKSFWTRARDICSPDINGVLPCEPFVVLGKEKRKSNVLDFEGSVAMIFELDDDSVLSLWTLDDVFGSWTKKFNLETDLRLDKVCLYLGLHHFVRLSYLSGYKLYDCEKKATRELCFPAQSTDVSSVVKFTESLVSLEGFELQE
ncbi:hypothetical protein POM88_026729 [Heracleum sosnowskyi]|uniref:F-box protein n=1 Tax=Heracleum sosnowskyi TaxID=360622 RepID=A0AAD8I7B8_9APIA|nr:hypothetical protein POM88_026729 [Heracleum sosnowskyi]